LGWGPSREGSSSQKARGTEIDSAASYQPSAFSENLMTADRRLPTQRT
jgi:hypothetical protein